MAGSGQEAYCTLLMNDGYLPGAMVLAHSLRDNGTSKQLAVLVTMNSLSASTIDELKKVYNHLIPVDQIVNQFPANLYLMHRPDLGSTFTKIALWRQVQFKKLVYIDADVVALRAPDELFDQTSGLAAIPDIGWPDCFNSGVLVLTPNMGDYYSLLALAQRGISFDGADQGLLNIHFPNWHRLSFTYNCTLSGNYQYVPAYRYFQSNISMVHFIGTDKPWKVGRDWEGATGVHQELMGRWWAVYDKYYRAHSVAFVSGQSQPGSRTVQQYVTGEASPNDFFGYASIPAVSNEKSRQLEASVNTTEKPLTEQLEPAEAIGQGEVKPVPTVQQRRYSVDWDPTYYPPPRDSMPEASNFPTEMYQMSSDPKLFKPPASYPPPPKDLDYQMPSTPQPAGRLKPIFPWEINMAKPARVFPDDPPSRSSGRAPSLTSAPSITTTDTQSETASPASPTVQVSPPGPFGSFTWKNVWDEMPEIERYVASLPLYRPRIQSHVPLRKKAVGSITPDVASSPRIKDPLPDPQQRRPSLILTDFPTEIERPSLPVTPAPIRRPSFWGQERDAAGDLPPAAGVPDQSQWNPLAKLLELQQRQSEILIAGPPESKRSIPERGQPESATPLPSDGSKSVQTVTAPRSATPNVEEPTVTQEINAEQKLEKESVISPVQS